MTLSHARVAGRQPHGRISRPMSSSIRQRNDGRPSLRRANGSAELGRLFKDGFTAWQHHDLQDVESPLNKLIYGYGFTILDIKDLASREFRDS